MVLNSIHLLLLMSMWVKAGQVFWYWLDTPIQLQSVVGGEATLLTLAGLSHIHGGGLTLSCFRMGSAGMTKLFFSGFSHPSSGLVRGYSHGGWVWLRLRLRTGILPFCPILLGKPSHNTSPHLRSWQRLHCWMGEVAKSHHKGYGDRNR